MTLGRRTGVPKGEDTATKDMLSVRTFPRIHMTLIDLAGVTHRKFGGAGFAIDALPATVSGAISKRSEVEGAATLDVRDRRDLQEHLKRLSRALKREFHVKLISATPQHVGLGSKTAVLMATAIVCNNLVGRPMGQTQLVLASGRGGTSGVGVNTTFGGGFVVDGGHGAEGGGRYEPSSARKPEGVPPALVRLRFPDAWRVHLFLPRGYRYSGEREVQFFRQNSPIGVREVHEVLAAVYHGIVPAIAEADLELLRVALREVHRTGFKRRELHGQGREVRELVEVLQSGRKLAAGMSSLGPLVYAIAPADRQFDGQALVSGGVFRETEYLGCFCARNGSYEVAEV